MARIQGGENQVFKSRYGLWHLSQKLGVVFSQIIYGGVDEKEDKGPSLLNQAAGIFSSINRFMKVISR